MTARAGTDGPGQAGFDGLYAELAPALHVWASLRIGPALRAWCEVDDLLQEVWCRACTLGRRPDGDAGAFRPWLFRIAKNVLLEVARRARYAARVEPAQGRTSRMFRLEAVADHVTTITRRVARDDALRAFTAHVNELPDDERDLVVHLGLEGMSNAEAATRLGVHAETLKKRWQRLRARLDLGGLPAALLSDDA